jgi:DNA polymerase-3 subunit epsilon
VTWHEGDLVAFDTESTGVDPTSARIVTATVLRINVARREITQRSWLINPGIPIPAEAAAVHGITTERAVAEGAPPCPSLEQIAGELRDAAWKPGTPLVIYNAPYDLTLLDRELRRCQLDGIEAFGGPGIVIDPLVIDRALDKYRKGKRTLTATCEHYQVRLDGAHDATADAIAAARLAWRLARQYPAWLQDTTLSDLQLMQATWQAEWAEHFETYLRTKGDQPDEVIDRGWPYRPAAATEAVA